MAYWPAAASSQARQSSLSAIIGHFSTLPVCQDLPVISLFSCLSFLFLNVCWLPNSLIARYILIMCIPSKHETSAQGWFTVGHPSTTLAQRLTNIWPATHVCLMASIIRRITLLTFITLKCRSDDNGNSVNPQSTDIFVYKP